MQHRFIFLILCSLINKNNYSDDQNKPHGIIIIREMNSNLFICYNRKQIPSDANKNWFAEINPKEQTCIWTENMHDCITGAIARCGWIYGGPKTTTVNFVYPLTFVQESSEMSELNDTMKRYERDINMMSTNFKLSFGSHILIDNKNYDIFKLLEEQFYTYKGSSLEQSAFLVIRHELFWVGIVTNMPHLYDKDLIRRFSMHGREYIVVVNEFRCLTTSIIKKEIYSILLKERISSGLSGDVIIMPCYPDGFEFIDKNVEKTFKGEYDFEGCMRLIRNIVRNEEFCEHDKYCNFSAIKKEFFGKSIELLKIDTNLFFYNEKKNSVFLQQLLLEKLKDMCIIKSETTWLAQLRKAIKCFETHVFYAILSDEFFINKEILLSIDLIAFLPRVSYGYLFVDPIFGLAIEENGPKTLGRQFETLPTVTTSIALAKSSITEMDFGEITPSKSQAIGLVLIIGLTLFLASVSIILVFIRFYRQPNEPQTRFEMEL